MRIQACSGGGDYLSDEYRAKASGSAQEACDFFVDAEDHLGLEHYAEAAEKSRKALESFRRLGDSRGSADALRVLVKALVGEGKQLEAQDLARKEAARFREAGDRSGEAKMLVSVAEANSATEGKTKAEAISAAKEARATFRSQGDKVMEARALLALAAVNMNKGDCDLAGVETGLKNASEARDLAQDADNKRLEAESLHAMAEARGIVSSPEDALEAADEAMDLYLELRDKRMEAFELMRMSEWNVKLGDHARALSDAEDALEIYQMLQSPQEVRALQTVFDAHMARADLRKARLVAAEALRRFREQGNKAAQVKASRMLVEMYVKAGRLDEALTAAKRGISVCKELADVAGHASFMIVIARARLGMNQTEKAEATAQDAWAMLKTLPSSTAKITDDKVEVMHTLADIHWHRKKTEAAKDLANEFKEHFEEAEDVRGLPHALLLVASLWFRLGKHDEASSHASKAQSLFNDEGELKGEADAMKMLAELHWKKNEFKAAVRLGERARALYRELEKLEGEIACMYLISENAVRLAVKEGAKIYSEEPCPRSARDGLEKGLKLAEAGIKMARNSNCRAPELLGSLLCARAQGLTLKARFEEALSCADEAVLLFRDLSAYQLEANALMLACDNLRALKQNREAAEAADEALALYQHVEDETGSKLANDVLESFADLLKPAAPQFMAPPPGAQAPSGAQQTPVWMQQQGQEEASQAVAKPAASRGPSGPALDVKSGLSLEVVAAKVKDIAARITGADDGEIEVDTPLMEAGLTSNSAILMRDELSQALPGVQLPVTLVFDYPSVSAMADLIMQSTGN